MVVMGEGAAGVGADLYNHSVTGDVSETVSANSCMTATRNGPSVIQTADDALRQIGDGIRAVEDREGGHGERA